MEALQKFSSDVSSWYWWISVVLVGVAVNLTSAWIKDPVDAWLAKRSALANRRRTDQQRKLHTHATRLAADPRLMTAMVAREWRHGFMALLMILPLSTAGAFVKIAATHPEKFSAGMLVLGFSFALVMLLFVVSTLSGWIRAMRLVIAAEHMLYTSEPKTQRAIRLHPRHWEKIDSATKGELEALLEHWTPETEKPAK